MVSPFSISLLSLRRPQISILKQYLSQTRRRPLLTDIKNNIRIILALQKKWGNL
jgi:hypothetical protein